MGTDDRLGVFWKGGIGAACLRALRPRCLLCNTVAAASSLEVVTTAGGRADLSAGIAELVGLVFVSDVSIGTISDLRPAAAIVRRGEATDGAGDDGAFGFLSTGTAGG